MNASWTVNSLLLCAKVAAFALSMSMSVLASAIDSVVDLLSQALIAMAERSAGRWDPRFPTGRSRLETVAVMGCAMIMACATILVIRECIDVLIQGFVHDAAGPRGGANHVHRILGAASGLKLWLWWYCRRLQTASPAMLALATDHWNDVLSNGASLITPSIAYYVPEVWWLDAVGGILISCYILHNWYEICSEQVDQIIGLAAPPEFVGEVEEMVKAHHADMALDKVIAYHIGHRYVVEVDTIMDAGTPLDVVHDMATELQDKIEDLDDVERAYVKVSYEAKTYLEHKVERSLHSKASELSVHKGVDARSFTQRRVAPDSSGRSMNGGSTRPSTAGAGAFPPSKEPLISAAGQDDPSVQGASQAGEEELVRKRTSPSQRIKWMPETAESL